MLGERLSAPEVTPARGVMHDDERGVDASCAVGCSRAGRRMSGMRGGGFDRAGVLPGPADQFCVYEGHYPLAYFLPTGYGEQIAPLLPDENGGEGIGAYQTMEGISGHVTLSVASCRHGLAPKSLTAVARTVLDLSNRSTTGMPFGLRIIGR